LGFANWREVKRALIRQQRAANDPQSMNPGALDQLAQAADDLVCRHILCRRVERAVTAAPPENAWRDVRTADVVHTLEDNQRAYAWLGEGVRIEARQCAHAGAVMKNTVATDAEIENGRLGGGCGEQSSSKAARPAPVGFRRRGRPIGDRIAECDNRADTSRSHDVEAVDPIPRSLRARVGQVGGTGEVPCL